MKLIKTFIEDLFIIAPNIFEDKRGYFFESYNKKKFHEAGLTYQFIQDNESKSSYGVIRGLHFQLAPYAQTKLLRVLQGEVFDVAVDLRKESKTFGKWFGVKLTADNKKQLLIPRGFAHGFSVLSETTIINYKCDNIYNKESERGIIWNDKKLNIDWNIENKDVIVSERDKNLDTFDKVEMNF